MLERKGKNEKNKMIHTSSCHLAMILLIHVRALNKREERKTRKDKKRVFTITVSSVANMYFPIEKS